jgi:hypothetical protein
MSHIPLLLSTISKEYVEEFEWLNCSRKIRGKMQTVEERMRRVTEWVAQQDMTSGNGKLTHAISFYVMLCVTLPKYYIALRAFLNRQTWFSFAATGCINVASVLDFLVSENSYFSHFRICNTTEVWLFNVDIQTDGHDETHNCVS